MKEKWKLVISLAVIVLFLDHLTKWFIVENLSLVDQIPVISNIFDIVHTRNKGAAFGFLNSWQSPLRNMFFYIIGIIAFAFLYFYIKGTDIKDKITLICLGLIFGGALGNLTDRMLRGSVVDFLSFHYYDEILEFNFAGYHVILPLHWPAFNVADMAISTAVILLIFHSFRSSHQTQDQPHPTSEENL